MNINLLVTGPLYSSQSAYSALRFCEAAVATGNTISQVFFYQDGVTQASKLIRCRLLFVFRRVNAVEL